MIIGGENIYKQYFKYVQKMYLTYIDVYIKNGDAYFPKFDLKEWDVKFKKYNFFDEKNKYNFSFKILEKISSYEKFI